jgi:hypothetical protein
MKLSSLTTVLIPGEAVTLNINQLNSETNIVLDIPTIDFRIENSLLFFEAEFPTIQSIEVSNLFVQCSCGQLIYLNSGFGFDGLQPSLPFR